MAEAIPYSDFDVTNFITALKDFTDPIDNRGKRHNVIFVIVSVMLAMFTGRSKLSSIHRYMTNKIDWLRETIKMPDESPVSRAQLPRIIDRLDWKELNTIIEKHFGIHIELNENNEWVALDGKTLRGTVGSGNKQAVVLAVTHQSRKILGQERMNGPKSSEIPVVRKLLEESGLDKQKVTLDAHHCNPKTTAQINEAGGIFLTQVKDNQPKLNQQCEKIAANSSPIGSETTTEKSHGRITTSHASLFSLEKVKWAKRWDSSAINTLIAMERSTYQVKKKKQTHEISYYITNSSIDRLSQHKHKELTNAIRNHWSVESDNWIRDVVFREDDVKNKYGNQAQIMGSFRTLAMRLFRKAGIKKIQAALETFNDCAEKFKIMLKKVNFL